MRKVGKWTATAALLSLLLAVSPVMSNTALAQEQCTILVVHDIDPVVEATAYTSAKNVIWSGEYEGTLGELLQQGVRANLTIMANGGSAYTPNINIQISSPDTVPEAVYWVQAWGPLVDVSEGEGVTIVATSGVVEQDEEIDVIVESGTTVNVELGAADPVDIWIAGDDSAATDLVDKYGQWKVQRVEIRAQGGAAAGQTDRLNWVELGEERVYGSIQAAIDGAGPGDTVRVEPGTYEENLVIDKSLNLLGPKADVPWYGDREEEKGEAVIDAGGNGHGIVIKGENTIATVAGFTVRNIGKNLCGILAGGFGDSARPVPEKATVRNNIVETEEGKNGIQLGNGTTGTVRGNKVTGARITGSDWSGSGILVAGSSNVIVEGNYVEGNDLGIGVVGYKGWQDTQAEDNKVIGNVVTGNRVGISVEAAASGTIIEGNEIRDNEEYGVQQAGYNFSWEQSNPSTTAVNNNVITGNGKYGAASVVLVEDGETFVDAVELKAERNYWGDPTGPKAPDNPSATGDAVSANVVYGPWLDAPEGDARSYNVFLDDERNFNSIQEAIAAADPGDTVNVLPGTYDEDITVSGVDKEGLSVRSEEEHGAILCGTVTIGADGVMLDGFKIQNFSQIPAPEYAGVYIQSGTGITVKNNEIDGTGIDPKAQLTVGIHTLYGGSAKATVENNTVRNVRLGIYNQGAELTLIDNTVGDAAHCGIGVDTSLGTEIQGGSVKRCAVGLEVFQAPVTVSGVSFEANHVQVDDVNAQLEQEELEKVLADNTFDRAAVARNAHGTIAVPVIYSKIQDAVDKVPAGGTVEVGPGEYEESPKIAKSLTLRSTGGRDETLIALQPDGPTYLGSLALEGQGSAITIDGFTIRGFDAGPRDWACTNIWVASGVNEVVVRNNRILVGTPKWEDNLDNGIGLLTTYGESVHTAKVIVTENVFEPVTSSGGRAFYINPGTGEFTFADNEVLGRFQGLSITQAGSALVEGNTVTGPENGERSAGLGAWGYPNPEAWGSAVFRGNEISNTKTAIAIFSANDVTVERNKLEDNDEGVCIREYEAGFDPGSSVVWFNGLRDNGVGVINKTEDDVCAWFNFWGPDGPNLEKDIVGPVYAIPWLYHEPETILEHNKAAYGYTVLLGEGWNTLSTPVELAAPAIKDIFPSGQDSLPGAVLRFNEGTETWEVPDEVVPLDGVYVFVGSDETVPAVLRVATEPTGPYKRDLKGGKWHLIGPSNVEYGFPEGITVKAALEGTGWTQVISPAIQGEWGTRSPSTVGDEEMGLFQVYWVFTPVDGVLPGGGNTPLLQPRNLFGGW